MMTMSDSSARQIARCALANFGEECDPWDWLECEYCPENLAVIDSIYAGEWILLGGKL